MTSATDDELRLAADFAPAGYDDWRKLVDGVLKGAPFEKLTAKTADGLRIEPIAPTLINLTKLLQRPTRRDIEQRVGDHTHQKGDDQNLHQTPN